MADKSVQGLRNVSPAIQMFRNFLLGRKHTVEKASLRYTKFVSPRTTPPPNLPVGEAHKLSANHYCLRDGRREVEPPVVLAEGIGSPQKRLTGAVDKNVKIKQPSNKPATPGPMYKWD